MARATFVPSRITEPFPNRTLSRMDNFSTECDPIVFGKKICRYQVNIKMLTSTILRDKGSCVGVIRQFTGPRNARNKQYSLNRGWKALQAPLQVLWQYDFH